MPMASATSFWVCSVPPRNPKRRCMICRSRSESRSTAESSIACSALCSMGRLMMSGSVPRISESIISLPSQSTLSGSSMEISLRWFWLLRRYIRISFSMIAHESPSAGSAITPCGTCCLRPLYAIHRCGSATAVASVSCETTASVRTHRVTTLLHYNTVYCGCQHFSPTTQTSL